MIPAQTISYKTYVKATLVEALRSVFAAHPDDILRKTQVGVDFSLMEAEYPAVIIRFYERAIKNAGVGHVEHLPEIDPETGEIVVGSWVKFKHALYNGDIEFAIYAQSSVDRDLIADSLVQTLTMGEMEDYTALFLARVYYADPVMEPTSINHFINLNTDQVTGFGETQQMVPWGAEDLMTYQVSYRVGIFGEFYSRQPTHTYRTIEKVELYPYMPAAGETRPEPKWSGPDGIQGTGDDQPDPGPWVG